MRVMIAAVAVFIVVAMWTRLNSPVRWNAQTATINAPADLLQHWPDGRLAINRATEAELCLLPGIGPARARAIARDRELNGQYTTIDGLDRVHGIGLKTIDWFDGYVVIEPR